MNSLNVIYKKKMHARIRNIGGKQVLFGIEKCFELNDVGIFICKHLDGKNTLEEIVNLLAEEYDCSREVLEKDVLEFVEFLNENNFLEEIG